MCVLLSACTAPVRGRIACANVLSDLYAMGVSDVDSVLMILAASLDMPAEWRLLVTRQMVEGFNAAAVEADCPVSGGQSILNPWAIIGGTASALCRDADVLLPHFAQPGDVLVLTKPLGIQVAVNVKQWSHQPEGDKYGRLSTLSPPWSRYDTLYAYHTALSSMLHLNRGTARLLHRHHSRASTDVTGFGLRGHAENLVQLQTAEVDFVFERVPCIRRTMEVSDRLGMRLREGTAAETSGGILCCMRREDAEAFVEDMRTEDGRLSWIVGRVVEGTRKVTFAADLRVIEV